MLKVLVTGGRIYHDPLRLWSSLNALVRMHGPLLIIHGAAKGADQLAAQWAHRHGMEEWVFPARWDLHGKAAGPIRNRVMYETSKPDVVVACPGWRGTANMLSIAQAGGTPIMRV